MHPCVWSLGMWMKEQQSEWAWQHDVFYLVWISVIFRPAGVSHIASHEPQADSHWHWWTSLQIKFLAQIYHTVLKPSLSPPPLTCTDMKPAVSSFISFGFSLNYTHSCSHMSPLTEMEKPCVSACVRLRRMQGRAFISLCWYSAAPYPVCQEQQRDNDFLYRRL